MGRNGKEVLLVNARVEKRRSCALVLALLKRRFESQAPANEATALLRLRDLTAEGKRIPEDFYNELGNGLLGSEKMYDAILEGNRMGFEQLKRQLSNGGKKA